MLKDLVGLSINDYPGQIGCVVFYSGCNFRCPFCHNPSLVLPELMDDQEVSIDFVTGFLKQRQGLISAITLTGGEPLLDDDLLSHVEQIRKNSDILIKLDTNGSVPGRLQRIIPLLDYVAIDIKAPPDKYPEATGRRLESEWGLVRESINIIQQSGKDYEFRTTMVPGLITKEDILDICSTLSPARWALQEFRNGETLDEDYADLKPYPFQYVIDTRNALKEICDDVVVR